MIGKKEKYKTFFPTSTKAKRNQIKKVDCPGVVMQREYKKEKSPGFVTGGGGWGWRSMQHSC